MKKTLLFLATGIGLAALSAAASTVITTANNGIPYQVPELSGFTTSGDQMAGMDAFVTFSDGSVQHANWIATGFAAGAATVPGFFNISESGDTFTDNAWTLQNLNSSLFITHFTLFGAGDDTVFDRTFGAATGTAGSALGKDFDMAGGNYLITATYSDILNRTGFAPLGDAYEQLDVDFDRATPFGPNASQSFSQDTDSAAVQGTITPVPDGGATAMLFGLGLTGLAAMRRHLG